MKNLKAYGLNDRFIGLASEYDKHLQLARVISQHKDNYEIISERGIFNAKISGKLRYVSNDLSLLPAVGDFVMIEQASDQDQSLIQVVLPRKSVFSRNAIGVKNQKQVIVANIDIVFICMSLNNNYSLNRLERYLAIAWDNNCTPVIVLTKSDLCDDIASKISEIEKISFYSDIIVTDKSQDNTLKFEKYLTIGTTTAFIGSSGVGKSTLINQLIEKEALSVQEIDKYDKGRHTTTSKQLLTTKWGGVVIDTPGIRELGIDQVDISNAFEDIEQLALQCKFSNCSHTNNEVGCQVLLSLAKNEIDERRYKNYLKLKNEATYLGLNSRQIEQQKSERLFKEVGGMKKVREFKQLKKQRKF